MSFFGLGQGPDDDGVEKTPEEKEAEEISPRATSSSLTHST